MPQLRHPPPPQKMLQGHQLGFQFKWRIGDKLFLWNCGKTQKTFYKNWMEKVMEKPRFSRDIKDTGVHYTSVQMKV